MVEAWSTSSITVESLRIPGVLGARQAAGFEPKEINTWLRPGCNRPDSLSQRNSR